MTDAERELTTYIERCGGLRRLKVRDRERLYVDTKHKLPADLSCDEYQRAVWNIAAVLEM